MSANRWWAEAKARTSGSGLRVPGSERPLGFPCSRAGGGFCGPVFSPGGPTGMAGNCGGPRGLWRPRGFSEPRPGPLGPERGGPRPAAAPGRIRALPYIYLYLYLYLYIYIYIYIYVYVYVYVYIHISLSLYIYIYMYTCMYLCIYTYIYTHIYISLCTCIYIYIYIHTYYSIIHNTII